MRPELVVRVRHAIYRTFAEGGVPRSAALSAQLKTPIDEIKASYQRLHEARAIVIDDRTKEVWMALPFSAVPTPHRVTSGERSWYANCAWDAFGIPTLIKGEARIESACGDCDAPIVYRAERGRIVDTHGVAHFVVPAARWWDNIGYT
jgi:Alkylmercury lyase